MNSSSQSREFFESRYQAAEDPWQFASSEYELARYDATLNALSSQSYGRVYEPGCSVGVLSVALAQRCNELIASDISARAVERARQRCAALDHVKIQQGDVTDGVPPGGFDLIIFSELGYYFLASRLKALCDEFTAALHPGGEFVAVHWLGESADHVLHGDEVHQVLGESLACDLIGSWRYRKFRIDSWRRPP